MIREFLMLTLLLGAPLLLMGCLDTEQEFTLNPDGSGKVILEATLPRGPSFAASADTELAARQIVGGILAEAKGVAAWSAVEFKHLEDGRIWLKGTAYFDDISRLLVRPVQPFRITWQTEGRQKGSLGVAIAFKSAPEEKPPGQKPAGPKGGEVEKEMARQRSRHQAMKPMAEAALAPLQVRLTFHLPGDLQAASGLRELPRGGLCVSILGSEILHARDALMRNDTWLRGQIVTGRDVSMHFPYNDPSAREVMFGERGPIQATVGGNLRPLFDYKKEATVAKRGYRAMLKRLGLSAVVPQPSRRGLKAVRLVGTQFVAESDHRNFMMPFSAPEGCVIALMGEFDSAFIEIIGGSLEKAIGDTGADLMPKDAAAHRLAFPCFLSRDRTKALAYFQLRMPKPGARGLRELAGALQYTTGSTRKRVDLGLEEFRLGAKGGAFDAEVVAVGASDRMRSGDAVVLRLNLPPYKVKQLVAWDAAGEPRLLLYNTEGLRSSKTTTFHVLKETLPEDGGLAVDIWADVETWTTPFELKNVAWQGGLLP